jgi:hypothetical protein
MEKSRIRDKHPGAATLLHIPYLITLNKIISSVADPDDPHVFGPPGFGSGSISSQRYGSGSFYHQAKIVRKIGIDSYCFVTSLCLFIFEK